VKTLDMSEVDLSSLEVQSLEFENDGTSEIIVNEN
jgi:hypothetical protein